MNRSISILLIVIGTLIKGEELYFEDFSTGSWPAGWAHEGNWNIGSSWQGNDTPPAAMFNWSPQQYNFEQNMVSPPVDVGDNESVLVEFYFALDFWGEGDLNGLSISYDGGAGWQEVLNYAIGPGLEIQNNPWTSNESFTADITGGSDLKIRWTAYGDDSWAIDGWIVDNIRILTLPQMESVSIASANEDPATAITGTDISLNFSSDSDLSGNPYVQINGNVCNVDDLGGRNYVANYTVQETDEDGPLQFTIDFTDVNGIDGSTVRQTTDNSVVIVDNSDPPPFGVGDLTATGGNVFNAIWNSTNTGLQLEVNVPQDSSVVNFDYSTGTSVFFDGANDEVSIAGNSAYQVTTSLTVEAWVKPLSAPSDYDGFLSYSMDAGGTQAGFGFSFYLTGWKFFLKTTTNQINYGAMAGAQLPVGQWTHIAATYNGSQVKLYRNGSLVNQNDAMGDVEWAGAPAEMVLGNFPKDGSGHFFDGNLDEIRIWDIVRTENEIKASKEISLAGDEDGLVGYWKLDEGSGITSEDLSSTGNDATLNGASWSENNSPIDFQTPIYDTGVIVGSAFQLAGRVAANEYELFGEKDTITIGDFNNGDKVISAPEESFESINSFVHEETAQVSAFLFDPAGNSTQGDVATTALVIDLIAEDPNSVSMVSNNTFTHLAKTGDVITATLAYGEDVNLPVITIDDNNAEESDLGSEQFQALYTFLGTEPEGPVNTLQSVTTDYLGNGGTYNGGSTGEGSLTVFYDRTLPTLDPVTIISNNSQSQWAKVGDQVTLNAQSSEPILTRAATIQSQVANVTDVSISEFNSVYQFTDSDLEGLVSFSLTFSDSAGNSGIEVTNTTNGSWVVFDKTSPDDFSTGSVIAKGGNEITEVWNSTNTSIDILVPIASDDTTLINGKVQIWAKIESNDWEQVGQLFNIENSDLGTNKLVSLTDLQVESITGFAEQDTITFKTVLIDRPGNQTEGSASVNRLVIDQTAPILSGIHIESDNSDSTRAKVGDQIKVSFSADEIINGPAVTISDNNATVSNTEDFNWIATYIMTESDAEGNVQFQISSYTDIRGNPADGTSSTSDGSQVIFDRTKPILDVVEFSTNNIWNQYWAKSGEQGTLTINASEGLLDLQYTLNSLSVTENWVSSSVITHDYSFTSSDQEGMVQFEIIYFDSSGNQGDTVIATTNNSYIIFDDTSPSDFTVGDVVSTGGNNVSLFWNSTNTGMDVIVPIASDTTLDSGRVQIYAKIGANAFEILGSYEFVEPGEVGLTKTMSIPGEQVRSITGYAEEQTITIRANIYDVPGNETIGAESTTQLTIEETSPSITYVSYRSNFSDTTLATVGHEITVTLRTNEPIQSPIATISSNTANIIDLGGDAWHCKYEMQDSDSDGIIPFQIGEIRDIAGNPTAGTETTTDGSTVVFDNTKPTLDPVRIRSSNADSTWAKVGDTISIKFVANELLSDQVTSIVGQAANISELGGGQKYLAMYEMIDSDPEGEVIFEIIVTDSVGLLSDPVTSTTNSSQVIFDRTLPTLDLVNIQSTNANNSSIAITGDDVVITFTPAEPLLIDSINVTIANEPATLIQDGDSYVATLTLSGDEPGGILPYTIDFKDRASNSGVQVTASTDDSYVNHDIVPPELLNISIFSNNLDTTWAKPGDTVFVKFVANEELDNLDVTISGVSSEYLDDGAANYRGYRLMNNNDNEGTITFNIAYTDLGGATGPDGNATTDETRVRYDRTLPILSNIRMSSNNAMGDSAGIGDIDSLFFTASEPQRNVEVLISDSNVVPIQNGSDFIATREMLDSDPDGLILFSIILEDSAGNSTGDVTETNDGSFVWFDGTPPLLDMVSFASTNDNDSGVAIIGDTLLLDFNSSELLSSLSVSIAGLEPDTTFEVPSRTLYRSWHVVDGSEEEGYIPFQIGFSDLVGNLGESVASTTDETSILFDMTSPIDFALDSVYVGGGNIKAGYWNASNDSIFIKTPIPTDDATLIGGAFQPQARFDDGEFINCGGEIEISSIPDNGQIILGIAANSFESMGGFSEEANAQFTTIIRDRAGNQTIGSSDNTIIHIDEITPQLDSVSISSNNILSSNWANISDIITISFTSEEGLDSPNSIILQDTINTQGIVGGTIWNGTYIIQQEDLEGLVSFNVHYSDTAGNIGDLVNETTDGTNVSIDKTRPDISDLLEGNDQQDLPYYNNADSVTLYWIHDDTVSGIRETYYALGTDSNSTDIIGWTQGQEINYGGWNNLNLSNDGIYFGGAFVRDSAGNFSDTIWGNGIYIDIEKPDTGSIIDGYWIMDLDYTPDSTQLNYRLSNFTDNTEIDHFKIAIGTGNDTTDVLDWTISDTTDSITITGLSLIRDTLYNTYIKAIDLAQNESAIQNTDGIYFDDSFPVVNKIDPDFYADTSQFLSVLSNDTIQLKFNRPIYSYDVQASSNVDSNFSYTHGYDDSVISIIIDNILSSYDTITLVLDSVTAYNTLTLTDTIQFFSSLWADLNNDYDITVEDILLFNQNWPETDLGPFSDHPPHVRPQPDGESNLLDLSAFAKMWQWRYFNLSFDTANVARIGGELDIVGRGSKVLFNIPKNTSMAEILIGYSNVDIERMNLIKPKNTTFLFKSLDTLDQMVQFSLADHRGLDSVLTLQVPESESHLFSSTIQYLFLDQEGNQLNKGISNFNINMLPDKFTVYNNYPNPFNPITTIKYDLPEVRDVQIRIIDLVGRTITSSEIIGHKPGRHTYTWNGINNLGKKVSTGMYFFILRAGQDTNIQKMLLLK